ncbi:purine nucleoside permease [Microvirga sp. BT688]|uniref:purine-nucleoside phosphorylase n=1 Tax=Microvirga sp. TaxID=1873136 RepID=UPI0016880438|nr:purine nucleoside permease [Microvirga sp.]MBD2750603.1 purine nucleoside permease [Microvirga sp.]
MSFCKPAHLAAAALSLTLAAASPASADDPVKVKIFIGSMFEIGQNTGDRAGEFQHWYERYFSQSKPITVKGALNPVYCNEDGVCGSVLGMGKVASSASVQAIILNPQFDMSEAYIIVSGVAGTPPERGTIADVSWATWLVDYDLGHRWAPEEGEPGAPAFMPRKGYEKVRLFQLNPDLVGWAMQLTGKANLKDSDSAQSYRLRYPQEAARLAPAVKTGTHMTGDTFFHGPGMSAQAQYIAKLYGADDYLITEMEAAGIAQVVQRTLGHQRLMSLRGAVNFDQGNPNETTLQHLDPAPGQTAGGFAETVDNIAVVGSRMVDHIVSHWSEWKNGVPPLPRQ